MLIVLLSLLFLGGCAQSIGALKIGPDTYSLSAGALPIMGGVMGAKSRALQEANKYCSSLGKEILLSNIALGRSIPGDDPLLTGGGTADITFLCLDKGDPQLQRPGFKPTTKIMPDFGFEGNIDINSK